MSIHCVFDLSPVASERLTFGATISDSLYKTLVALGEKVRTCGDTGVWSIGECL